MSAADMQDIKRPVKCTAVTYMLGDLRSIVDGKERGSKHGQHRRKVRYKVLW